MTYLLRFRDPLAASLEQSGGKGANLAFLTQRGFPVPEGLIVTTQAFREYAATSALPAGLAAEIRAEISPGRAMAVRSSSTSEDQAGAAFAGLHDTFLNVTGPDAILEKIEACYRSLWSDRAAAYRSRRNLDPGAAAMAVVIQPMVACDAAGVAFSIDPVSGDLESIVVDANFGLGESVVSGETEVDHFVLDRRTRTLRERRIARKSRKVVGLAGGGTQTTEIGPEDRDRPCLEDGILLRLADLVLDVEKAYGFPQDVEWGISEGRLQLLQSRPITTVPPRWTRDESAERFPNVMTPLTWDFLDDGFHRSLHHSFRILGFPPFDGRWFGLHGHYVYGNQNAVELYLKKAALGVTALDQLRAAIPGLRERYRWVQELPVHWTCELDHYLLRIGELMAEPLDSKDLKGLWRYIRAVSERGAEYFKPNIAISIAHSGLCRLLHQILRLVAGDTEGPQLFNTLLATCETKTGAINRELFELASEVHACPPLEKLFAAHDSKALVRKGLLRKFPAFDARFAKFLRDHGHRELDFDMFHPTWIDAPWTVLDSVRLVLHTPMDCPPAERERTLKMRMQSAEFGLLRRLPEDLHYFVTELIRLARVYTSLDDLEHYQTTRLALPMRKGLRALGDRLVERKVLDDPMDIFFARLAHLEETIEADTPKGWKGLTLAIRQEKRAYEKDRARRPDWVLGAAEKEDSGEALSGLPGSPGEAEGSVCIVLSPEDFARFPKGAILVARTTNPTWTPLFYSAAAVVTESGGPLSHGAVTAREMRIPAVMSVPGSLRRLKNGDRIRVDGSRGKVFML
ncbi:MAG: phosphoenolpyruvate synthase [Planctomycetes bacterium]|nr:phosphoenolpyruvate synthase [Planctomycetota bacterium]